jgi:hypothetical protein
VSEYGAKMSTRGGTPLWFLLSKWDENTVWRGMPVDEMKDDLARSLYGPAEGLTLEECMRVVEAWLDHVSDVAEKEGCQGCSLCGISPVHGTYDYEKYQR